MPKFNQLTALKVARLTKPGRYGDGLGLWLQVTPAGAKSWLFRFQRAGKARQMGLGPIHTVSLADARLAALEARKTVLRGDDPIETRKAKRREGAGPSAISFEEAAKAYIASHKSGWKNQVHAKQWPSSLEAYAYPVIGKLDVSMVDTGQILKVLEPIWQIVPDTAGRVRGRLELILDWAKARGYRNGENPARWRGHLNKLLPAPTKVRARIHHPALPYSKIPSFMAELRKREGIAARCLEFTILTLARTSEAIGGLKTEIDAASQMWTVPGVRMKSGREHRVPLSSAAITILNELPTEDKSPFLFLGARAGKPLSNMAMLKVLHAMGRNDLTVHGFRSTFKDWAIETTEYPGEVSEMALAHAVGDKVEAAYRRGDLLQKRKSLSEDWASFCYGECEVVLDQAA